jgi:chorismate dehydratase
MLKFGSISYLNLLPFQVYMKRRSPSTQFAQMLRWQRAVPSIINRRFRRHEIDAAFISSIASTKAHCTDLGIVADGAVRSVLLIPGIQQDDRESASSNALARVLRLEGKVLIGDKALIYHLQGGKAIDLARAWKERTGLPFVFARLCHTRNGKRVHRLARDFARQERYRIPGYLLRHAAAQRGIAPKELQWYLEHIGYRLGWKEKKSLKRFLKEARKLRMENKE